MGSVLFGTEERRDWNGGKLFLAVGWDRGRWTSVKRPCIAKRTGQISVLGASDVKTNGWLATDFIVSKTILLTPLEDKATEAALFSRRPLDSFACARKVGGQTRYKYGDDRADQVELAAPLDVIVVASDSELKAQFLEKVKMVTGDEELKSDELKNVVQNNGTTFLWSNACYSGQWLSSVPWIGYMADSLVTSTSLHYHGSVNGLTTFATVVVADAHSDAIANIQTHANPGVRKSAALYQKIKTYLAKGSPTGRHLVKLTATLILKEFDFTAIVYHLPERDHHAPVSERSVKFVMETPGTATTPLKMK
ncbi:hypothetical protein C8J56DRAFT_901031 [Mycena floridula]|nr:hypothetical protein C8J56DRAFT_901031 [Mycena floridula]